MGWLPEDASFLAVFVAVTAVVVGLIGVLSNLGQMSGSAKARRTMEWTSDALRIEVDPARVAVLERMKLRAQGYLVAANDVPWWRFTEVITWLLLSPVLVVLSFRSGESVWSLVTANLLAFAVLWSVVRKGIRLYTERLRVVAEYAAGGSRIRAARVDILHAMEGGTRREFALSAICSVALLGTSSAVALALSNEPGSQYWLWVAFGGFVSWSCFRVTRNYVLAWAEKSALAKRDYLRMQSHLVK